MRVIRSGVQGGVYGALYVLQGAISLLSAKMLPYFLRAVTSPHHGESVSGP